MKKYVPDDDYNCGSTLHGLMIRNGEENGVPCYRALSWRTHILPWWNDTIFQELLYANGNLRAALATSAEFDWLPNCQVAVRQAIMRIFSGPYHYRIKELPGYDYQHFQEACVHLRENVQIVVDWCMYEYSHYPYEWGWEPPPRDISKFVPDNLWAPDISKVAHKIIAGKEVRVDKVRAGEYDYDRDSKPGQMKKPKLSSFQPAGKIFGGATITEDQFFGSSTKPISSKESQEEARVAKELAKIEKELAKREQEIEQYATELSLDHGNKPTDGLVVVTNETEEILAKYIRSRRLKSLRGKPRQGDTSNDTGPGARKPGEQGTGESKPKQPPAGFISTGFISS